LSGSFKTSGLVNDLLAKDLDITVLQTFYWSDYREATFSENLYQIREWFCPLTPQPMRYAREQDAITVAWRVTIRIRVYRGGSYDALIGAANTKMNGEV